MSDHRAGGLVDAAAHADRLAGVRTAADVPGPVRGNTGAALDLGALASPGVARVSFGPRFHRQGPSGLRGALERLRAGA